MDVEVKPLESVDKPYALTSWRESHHQGAMMKGIPWPVYKREYGTLFWELLNHSTSLVLGAYRKSDDQLMGFLVATPGKRIDVLHWVSVRHTDKGGEKVRRQGIMMALINAADLGTRWIYTLKGRNHNDSSLDEVLAKKLSAKGITPVYVPLHQWLSD